jgi:quercetin dioxygenase-like cupin family protein
MGTEGKVVVYIWQDNVVAGEFTLRDLGDTVIVPPGRVHALYAPVEYNRTGIDILVVTSSQDPADIEWEPETDRLIKNEHLNV